MATDEDVVAIVLATSPDWILFDDLQVSTGCEFSSLQRYYGTHIPCRFLNFLNLVSEFRDAGYRLRGSWRYAKTYSDSTSAIISEATNTPATNAVPITALFERGL